MTQIVLVEFDDKHHHLLVDNAVYDSAGAAHRAAMSMNYPGENVMYVVYRGEPQIADDEYGESYLANASDMQYVGTYRATPRAYQRDNHY